MAELLTANEVARRFNVTGSSIRRWILDGHVAAIRTPGGQYRIDPAEVERLMAAEVGRKEGDAA